MTDKARTDPARPRPVLLCILDGWGHRPDPAQPDNAIWQANTPNLDRLAKTSPISFLDASESSVGLPLGQMGNSEVGHMNIGGGRVVMQDLPRIDQAVADGSLAKNSVLLDYAGKLKASGGTCHLMGLASPGGVHSHQAHIAALANIVAGQGVKVAIHAFLDGRDTPPASARGYLADFQKSLKSGAAIATATVSGRFYAMDRDKRWDRIEKAYNAMVLAQGEHAGSADAAVTQSYERKTNDEFVLPTVIGDYAGMTDGDGVLMGNFRADRAREILHALLDPAFDGFTRHKRVSFAAAAGLVEYSDALNKLLPALFPAQTVSNSIGQVVSKAGMTQLRIAETEKYAHVTFFFNGGEEKVFPGEDRILVPSPRVPTYDLQPEMSAYEVTDRLVEAIDARRFDLIVVNYANPDQVGHSGVFPAAVQAVETVDACLGRLMDAVERAGGALLVTADHGNVEQLFDYETNQPHTAHTMNKVPAILFNAPREIVSLADGRLADVAPTLLALMGVKQPAEMTGQSLLRAAPRAPVLAVPAAMRAEAARKVA